MTAENQMTGKTGEVGRLLKAAREESRQNLRDVAERLRIRYQFLEAIEDGRYQDLPGAAYANGFVRAYAEYLGLDGLEIARRFKEEGAVGKVGNELSFPVPAAESGLPSRSLLLAGVAMLGVVYGVWHYVGSPDKPLADMVQDIPDRIAALMRSTPDAEDALKREPVIAPASQSPAPAPQVAVAPAAPPAPVTPVVAPVVVPPAPPPPAAPAKPAHSETAQEPISTAEADIEPPAEEHEDPPAVVAPLPAPTAALPSVPAAPATGSAPAVLPAVKPVVPPSAAHPSSPATPPAPAAVPAAKPVTAAPASVPAAPPASVPAVQTAAAPAKPTAQPPAPAVPPAPAAAGKPVTAPASPLAALPSQPSAAPTPAAPAAASPAPAATPARVEPTTAPVERQGTDAGADGASSQGRIFGEENGGARVVLRARADSWVQVRNADGLLMSRLLRKGDSYMVPNQGGLELMTGNAGGLDIVVDGKTLPTLGKAGEVRKGIPLQPEALKAGAAQ